MPANHSYNKDLLIQYADGTHFTTCLDANEHLLCDLKHTGEIDPSSCNYAFHEHNGRGPNNTKSGNPFTNFWFDDNSFAVYMSRAYN